MNCSAGSRGLSRIALSNNSRPFSNCPRDEVIPGQALNGAHVGRVQGERPFSLRDGLLEAPLVEENPGLYGMSAGGSRVEGEGLRHQFVRPLEVGLGVGARAHIDRLLELHGQDPQGADIVGIDAERLLAERVTRIRFLAEPSGFLQGRLTLESQILGVRDSPRASV